MIKFSKPWTPQTAEEKEKMSNVPFRQLGGTLIYTLQTRPDCAVAINEFARYMENYGRTMWTVTKRPEGATPNTWVYDSKTITVNRRPLYIVVTGASGLRVTTGLHVDRQDRS